MKLKTKILIWYLTITVLLNLLLVGTLLGIYLSLPTEQQNEVQHIIFANFHFIFLLVVLVIIIQGAAMRWLLKYYMIPLTQLIEELEIITNVNADHRIPLRGGRDIRKLTEAINISVDQLAEVKSGVDQKIDQAKNDLEEEKNTLAALISKLNEGVLICNNDGQILLYNPRVRELLYSSSEKSESNLIGLGRSVFSVLDRNLLAHSLDKVMLNMKREKAQTSVRFTFINGDSHLLDIQTIPVLNRIHQMNGFILIVYDVSKQVEDENRRAKLLQSLSGKFRSRTGAIRAAIEIVRAYPDMDDEKRAEFLKAIEEESLRLSDQLEGLMQDAGKYLQIRWPLEETDAVDFLNILKEKLETDAKLQVDLLSIGEEHLHVWIHVESYPLANLLTYSAGLLSRAVRNRTFSLRLIKSEQFAGIDLVWEGESAPVDLISTINTHPLSIPGSSVTVHCEEILERHNAALWSIKESDEKSVLRLLIPASFTQKEMKTTAPISVAGRPEFYDFDLFHQEGYREFDDLSLRSLRYTVFDTETTGLNIREGDEIISMGAVRILNMRLLKEETFDQLVDPQRYMSDASIKIHGIQREMLEGQPLIDTVLPEFYKFCENSVMVAHNAAFDMLLLKLKEERTGIRFSHPVLDTLLLSAVLHPGQESHNLEAISERLGVNMFGRHTALGDAWVTAEVLLKLIPLLETKGIRTLKEAREASKNTYYARIKY